MGVKGLTTYIAKKADQYLVPFELHDTCLVIDGDSIASNLYQWSPHTNSAFGGDYNQYHHIVQRFFAALHRCRVRSFVLLDGGYQRRKLKTVHARLRAKICSIRHLNPLGGNHMFPLHMRECFVDAVRASPGAHLMRCLFEADDEVAELARQLNCPVLSYDSDFYIHNVQYIPSVTLTMRPLKRSAPRRNRRRPASTSARVAAEFEPYWYMDCCVYTIANLARGQIRDEVLPLFGVLLGNDYVGRHVFAKFFAGVSTKNVGKRNSPQQKRIIGLLRWLRGETLASARGKVLGSVELAKRGVLAREIEQAMEGYVRASSEAFAFFGLGEEDVREGGLKVAVIEAEEEEEEDDEEDKFGERADRIPDADDDVEENDDTENTSDSESDQSASDDTPHQPITDDSTTVGFKHRNNATALNAPVWLLRLIYEAHVPRYVVDLLALRMYINAPQVENVQMLESNHLARPILAVIYTLVHHEAAIAGDTIPDLVYLTRDTKNASTFVNIALAVRSDVLSLPFRDEPANADRTAQNARNIIGRLFADHPNAALVWSTIDALPAGERLFALSLAYAAHNSANLTRAQLHALLLCMFALHRSYELCSYMDEEHFQKQHRRYVEAYAKQTTATTTLTTSTTEAHEAIMLARNLLPHLQLNRAIRTRHTSFSATAVHAFAEWQAVMFHMNTLNALLGEPFERMHVGRLFNGTLAYNLSVALQERPDMSYYMRQYVFRDCGRWAGEYEALVRILEPLVQRFEVDGDANRRKSTRNQRKLAKKRAAKTAATSTTAKPVDGDATGCLSASGAEEDAINGYEGLGNRFAKLIV